MYKGPYGNKPYTTGELNNTQVAQYEKGNEEGENEEGENEEGENE